MREYNFKSNRSEKTSNLLSYQSYQPVLQRKRTLDGFPMEHSLQDTHILFHERRVKQNMQRQNLASIKGESKLLSNYGRQRFDIALSNNGGRSLPPNSPQEKPLLWEEVKPILCPPYKRYASQSAPTLSKPFSLSPRPESASTENSIRSMFNHYRGNKSAYPMIRKLLQESNTEYRVVCPFLICHHDVERPPTGCSMLSECLLVPLDENTPSVTDEAGVSAVGCVKKNVEGLAEVKMEDILHKEMMFMSNLEEGEGIVDTGKDIFQPTIKTPKHPDWTDSQMSSIDEEIHNNEASIRVEDNEYDKDESNPFRPRYCWVDDATVSSINSRKSETETITDEATHPPPQTPEVVAETSTSVVQEASEKGQLNVMAGKSGGQWSAVSGDKKGNNTPPRQSRSRSYKKGGKPGIPESIVEVTVELPPPPTPPPVDLMQVEKVTEEEFSTEAKLPPYICPSSTIKSTQTEIKLWLYKSTFSAATRLHPMY